MGGGGKYPPVLTDPAIEKWYHMKENTHAYYRLNRRTMGIGFALTVALPAIFYFGSTFNGNYQPTGVRRGESFWIRDAAAVSTAATDEEQ
ncbi:hypothetical protein HDU89_005092 [Geranomyces variabilis]|nr:hypothetical protein HDU89_005092 [Geranomyces variabilis]